MKWSANVESNGSVPVEISTDKWNTFQRAFPFESNCDDAIEKFIAFDDMSVGVRLQRGPVNEVGVNGAQIDDLLKVGLVFLQKANQKFPCRENALAITKLEEALMWLDARTRNREERGVEGKNVG